METITISAKGQIVIPARIRKKFALTKGTKLKIIEEEGHIKILMPEKLTALCGTWSDIDRKSIREQIERMRNEEDRY
ncbi:MAG TPA: AbrB/MazE/SpoVT family DNA-binding domain-containing protein [Methanosarcinaceae archaeon]|nr:AbrB/MazE/SpoVT family DNA-binding domain-containing protein [Methanosarcinaceae archaeon]